MQNRIPYKPFRALVAAGIVHAASAFVPAAMPAPTVAAAAANEDLSGISSEPVPVALRESPLRQIPAGQVLVAGEKLSAYWAAGDSLRPMIHCRKPGSAWRVLRMPDPTANGRLRRDWRLPADLLGPLELRFSADGRMLDSVKVMVVAPAGSPQTGPVLDSPLEAFMSDDQADRNFIPHRTAEELADIQRRFSAAEGGKKCLPDYASLASRAMSDARRFAGGVPILPSRVRYHYREPGLSGLPGAEFRGLGFAAADVPSNHVVFLLSDAYLFTDINDPVARVELRIGTDTLTVKRNGQTEYVFATDGMQTVFLRAVTVSGAIWEQAAVLDVKAVTEDAEAPAPVQDAETASSVARPARNPQ